MEIINIANKQLHKPIGVHGEGSKGHVAQVLITDSWQV